jgi:hypothetical protein
VIHCLSSPQPSTYSFNPWTLFTGERVNLLQPGYRESEEDEPTLSAVLDSLIPFIRDNKNATKLPVYKGKAVMDTTWVQRQILPGHILRGWERICLVKRNWD